MSLMDEEPTLKPTAVAPPPKESERPLPPPPSLIPFRSFATIESATKAPSPRSQARVAALYQFYRGGRGGQLMKGNFCRLPRDDHERRAIAALVRQIPGRSERERERRARRIVRRGTLEWTVTERERETVEAEPAALARGDHGILPVPSRKQAPRPNGPSRSGTAIRGLDRKSTPLN